MAIANRRERGLFDPDAAPGASVFDHFIYVIASDGDIEEGVSSEASSIAGRQELGNLVVIYDDNKISIEDDTNIALSEDTAARYEAYGWHVQVVDSGEDVTAILAAVEAAKAETGRPSFILLRTVIGYPAPNKMNTGKAHGAALGDDEVAEVKKILGFDPEQKFAVEHEVLAHTRMVAERGKQVRAEWEVAFDAWARANPERKALLDRASAYRLPDGWTDALPIWEPDEKGVATRKASGEVLSALADVLPELWGGSADLAESNNTTMKGADSFGPHKASTKEWNANPYGRTLHFGVREHAMGSILNGIVLHGPTRPYGATFLVFSDYMRPPVRLAALQQLPVTYVWTHDSIGLGEDGPTHQPIEHLAALRAIPGLVVLRPGDANETAAGWRAILEQHDQPVGLALTRQNLPGARGHPGAGRRGRAPGRLRAGRRGGRRAAGGADRHRLGAADGGRGTEDPRGRRRCNEGGLDAVRGVVRGAGRGLPRRRAPALGAGAGRRRGRDRAAVAPVHGRRRRDRVDRALRRVRGLPDSVPRVRLHLRSGRDGGSQLADGNWRDRHERQSRRAVRGRSVRSGSTTYPASGSTPATSPSWSATSTSSA